MNPFVVGALLTAYVAALSLVVGALPSTRMRAVVYSMPIPMSLLSLLGPDLVDPHVITGLLVNASFFWLVALGDRLGWHRLPSTLAATVAYAGAAYVLNAGPSLTVILAVAVSLVIWGGLLPVIRRIPPLAVSPVATVGVQRLLIVFLTAAGAVAIAGILGPYVVTFPYTGITMSLTYPGSVVPFARSFWINGLPPLLAYGTGLAAGAAVGIPMWGAVLCGLAGWGIVTAGVAWAQRSAPEPEAESSVA